jgi:hypothetical protein
MAAMTAGTTEIAIQQGCIAFCLSHAAACGESHSPVIGPENTSEGVSTSGMSPLRCDCCSSNYSRSSELVCWSTVFRTSHGSIRGRSDSGAVLRPCRTPGSEKLEGADAGVIDVSNTVLIEKCFCIHRVRRASGLVCTQPRDGKGAQSWGETAEKEVEIIRSDRGSFKCSNCCSADIPGSTG